MCKFSAKACHVSLHYFIFYFTQYLLGNLLLMDVIASVNGRRKGSLKIGNTQKKHNQAELNRKSLILCIFIHLYVIQNILNMWHFEPDITYTMSD